jgi:DNA-binding GntR family transcriptional regulator
VREALTRLQHERLLERGARGLQVHRVDPQEVIQVYDLRVMLEEEVAGQAAASRSSADVIKLEALVERDRSLVDADDQLRTKSNLAFHTAVWAATHNPVLQDLLERLSTHLIHSPHSTLSVEGRWSSALDEHSALVEAIADRRVEDARRIARAHLETARALRLGLIRDAALTGQD